MFEVLFYEKDVVNSRFATNGCETSSHCRLFRNCLFVRLSISKIERGVFMKLQEKIYYCRKKAGYSQEALAEQLGVSRQAISKWENGDAEPEISKLRLLAQAFDVTADWLLTDEEPEEPYEKERVIYSTYGSDSNSNSNSNWVESVPGVFGKLIKRYGWLFGVYVAASGASLVFIGGLMRYMTRRFFSGFQSNLYLILSLCCLTLWSNLILMGSPCYLNL